MKQTKHMHHMPKARTTRGCEPFLCTWHHVAFMKPQEPMSTAGETPGTLEAVCPRRVLLALHLQRPCTRRELGAAPGSRL